MAMRAQVRMLPIQSPWVPRPPEGSTRTLPLPQRGARGHRCRVARTPERTCLAAAALTTGINLQRAALLEETAHQSSGAPFLILAALAQHPEHQRPTNTPITQAPTSVPSIARSERARHR